MHVQHGRSCTFTVSSDDCSSSDGCSLCTTIPKSCASRPSCFTLKFTTVVFVDTLSGVGFDE